MKKSQLFIFLLSVFSRILWADDFSNFRDSFAGQIKDMKDLPDQVAQLKVPVPVEGNPLSVDDCKNLVEKIKNAEGDVNEFDFTVDNGGTHYGPDPGDPWPCILGGNGQHKLFITEQPGLTETGVPYSKIFEKQGIYTDRDNPPRLSRSFIFLNSSNQEVQNSYLEVLQSSKEDITSEVDAVDPAGNVLSNYYEFAGSAYNKANVQTSGYFTSDGMRNFFRRRVQVPSDSSIVEEFHWGRADLKDWLQFNLPVWGPETFWVGGGGFYNYSDGWWDASRKNSTLSIKNYAGKEKCAVGLIDENFSVLDGKTDYLPTSNEWDKCIDWYPWPWASTRIRNAHARRER